MKNYETFAACLLAATLALGAHALAEETKLEKVEASANKATDSVARTYRSAKDKACEMVNGKLECATKKIKNSAKNLKDKIETTASEVKNKVD
jgi:hypothetical protein